jgi:hypothetical protein
VLFGRGDVAGRLSSRVFVKGYNIEVASRKVERRAMAAGWLAGKGTT